MYNVHLEAIPYAYVPSAKLHIFTDELYMQCMRESMITE